MKYAELVLIRHFETESNLKGVFGKGHEDVPSERGRRQMEALRGRLRTSPLRTFRRCCTGTMRRQMESAHGVFEGEPPLTPGYCQDSRLNELSVGEWAGLDKREVDQELLAAWRAGKYTPPGGETKDAFEARVLEMFGDLRSELAGFLTDQQGRAASDHAIPRIVVMTSGNPIRFMVGEVLGVPAERRSRMDVDNCSLTTLRLTSAGKMFVASLNDVSHLAECGFTMLP